MQISKNQTIMETLIGLRTFILLIETEFETEEYSQKRLIVPHGTVKVHNENTKKIVTIEFDNVCSRFSSKYFSYTFDESLQRIKADNSITAWLYLALLHASTSQILADPYLGLTGTEMALNLLQSANCWSCRPLTNESLLILQAISSLSPKRTYYPKRSRKMQTTTWPNEHILPSICAHEAFYWLTKRIEADSNRLKFAFEEEEDEVKEEEEQTSEILSKRAYHRVSKYYTDTNKVDLIILQSTDNIGENISHPVIYDQSTSFDYIRKIAMNRNSLEFGEMSSEITKLVYEKNSEEILKWNESFSKKIFEKRIFAITREISSSPELFLKNYWLEIYRFAKIETNRDKLTFILSYLAYKGKVVNNRI